MENLKQCTKCKEWKEKEYFYKHKNRKDGLNHLCKQCVKEYQKEYRENNKEKVKEYRENNKEKIIKKK